MSGLPHRKELQFGRSMLFNVYVAYLSFRGVYFLSSHIRMPHCLILQEISFNSSLHLAVEALISIGHFVDAAVIYPSGLTTRQAKNVS